MIGGERRDWSGEETKSDSVGDEEGPAFSRVTIMLRGRLTGVLLLPGRGKLKPEVAALGCEYNTVGAISTVKSAI